MADSKVPQHIAYVIDGNRRWAKERDKPAIFGHQAGFDVLKNIFDYTAEKGVKYVTGFVFSTENWDRSKNEISALMNLFRSKFNKEIKRLHERNVRFVALGRKEKLDQDIIDMIQEGEKLTENNTAGTVSFCFNYGGAWEITEACQKLVAAGEDISNLTPEIFAKYLYHPEVPPVDMLVRTSGEHRTSGFMLYRAAYSELMFVDKNWPDMQESDVDDIIAEYQRRNRRFGK